MLDLARSTPDTVVVTRHRAMVQYLRELGLVDPNVRVIEHATEEDVRDRIVFGVLPLRLAALTVRMIEVPLLLPAEARGRELSLEEVRRYAAPPAVWIVRREE